MAHSIFQGLGSQTAQEVSGMLGLMASVAPAGAASTVSWTVGKNCLLEKTALYQLPGNPQNLPARSEKAACLSPVIHFGSSVQHKPPRWTQIKASVQTGETALWPFPLRKDLISQVKGTI